MSTANKLTYLNTTKSKIKNAINLAGANITNEPFRAYSSKLYDSYLDILKNGTSSLYASMPKVIGTGTELSLKNTAEAPMVLELGASESTQDALLPSEYQQVEYIESSNVQAETYIDLASIDYNDAIIECEMMISSRPNEDNNYFGYNDNANQLEVGLGWGGSSTSVRMNKGLRVDETLQLNKWLKIKLSPTFEGLNVNGVDFPNSEVYSAGIWGSFSTSVSLQLFGTNRTTYRRYYPNLKIRKFKVTKNNQSIIELVSCYRKSDNEIGLYDLVNNVFYTNKGTGTFTKGADVINNINVTTGENKLFVASKNFIKLGEPPIVPGLTITKINDSTFVLNGTVNSGTRIIWQTQSKIPNKQMRLYVRTDARTEYDDNILSYLYRANDSWDLLTYVVKPNSSSTMRMNSIASDTYAFGIFFNANVTLDNLKFEIQLEFGNSFNDKSEANSEWYPLSLGNLELAGIGDYKDKIFNNIPNNPLYDANLVEGGWYKYKMIDKYIFTGNENFTSSGNYEGIYQFNTYVTNSKVAYEQNILYVISNYFKGSSWTNSWLKNNAVVVALGNGTIRFMTDKFTSTTDFANWLSQKYQNNEPVVICVVLNNPTTEQITDTTLISQLEALKNAVSYDDETNISQTNANRPFIFTASAISNTMGGE